MTNTIYKMDVAGSETHLELQDNGGRRIGIERRNFSYSLHIPERRFDNDRRKIKDRRETFRNYKLIQTKTL